LPVDFLPVLSGVFRYWFLLILEPMKPPGRRRKCLNCKELFLPNRRAAQRQRYCLKAECRKARKRALQRAWLAKPENRNYFRDAKNAERVRDWQKAHPGYWKNTARHRRRTLQDACPAKVAAGQPATAQPGVVPQPSIATPLPEAAAPSTRPPSPPEPALPGVVALATVSVPSAAASSPSRTLQDLCSMPVPLLVGIISMFIGSTLPDEIATSLRRLLIKGHDILGMVPGMNVERLLHEKTCPQSAATPESPASVQLDRPPAGTGQLLRPL